MRASIYSAKAVTSSSARIRCVFRDIDWMLMVRAYSADAWEFMIQEKRKPFMRTRLMRLRAHSVFASWFVADGHVRGVTLLNVISCRARPSVRVR